MKNSDPLFSFWGNHHNLSVFSVFIKQADTGKEDAL